MTDEPRQTPFEKALTDILTPLAVALVARGLPLASATEALKRAMLAAILRESGDDVSDSRVALLTGLHRKDVRRLRSEPGGSGERRVLNYSALVVGHWISASDFLGANGQPRELRREATRDGPGFDDLVRRVRIDAAAGTVIATLIDQGMVIETDQGGFRLAERAYIPTAESGQLIEAFRATLTAHLETAVHNLLADAPTPRRFDRIVRYSHLTDASVTELESMARDRAQHLLEELNDRARILQDRDTDAGGSGRFTAGAFVTPERSGHNSK